MFYQAKIESPDPLLEAQSAQDRVSSLSDYIKAIGEETLQASPLPSMFRSLRGELTEEEGDQLSIDELKSRYGMGGIIPFDRTMTAASAQDIYDRKKREIENKEIIRSGGQGIFRQGVGLVTGFATTFADPSNIGLSLVPGLGEERIAANLGLAYRGIGNRAIVGGVAGLANAGLAEIPVWYQARQEYADYQLSDSLVNVAFGTGAGATIGTLGGAFSKWHGSLDNEAKASLSRAAIGQMDQGHAMNLDQVLGIDNRVIAHELSLGRSLSTEERLKFLEEQSGNQTIDLNSNKDLIEAERSNRLKEFSKEQIKRIDEDANIVDKMVEEQRSNPSLREKSVSDPSISRDEEIAHYDNLETQMLESNRIFTESPEGKALLEEIDSSKSIAESQSRGVMAMAECFLKNIF